MQKIRSLITVAVTSVVVVAGAYLTAPGPTPPTPSHGPPPVAASAPAPKATTVTTYVKRYNNPAAFGVMHHQAGSLAGWSLPSEPWKFFENVHGYAVAYNWVIPRSGALWPGRGEEFNSAANLGLNQRAVAFCFAGNLDLGPPTDAQLVTAGKLVAAWRVRHPGIKLIRHRDVAGIAKNRATTGCPGRFEERLNLRRVVEILSYCPDPAKQLAIAKKRALDELRKKKVG